MPNRDLVMPLSLNTRCKSPKWLWMAASLIIKSKLVLPVWDVHARFHASLIKHYGNIQITTTVTDGETHMHIPEATVIQCSVSFNQCIASSPTICLNVYHKLLLSTVWEPNCYLILFLLWFTQMIGMSPSSVPLHFHNKDTGFVIIPRNMKHTPSIWLNRFHNWTKLFCFPKCCVNF